MPRVAFRTIRGRKRYFTSDLADRIKRELGREIEHAVKPTFIKDFEAIVANWKHKVRFASRKYITPEYVAVTVHPTGPNAKLWNWVSQGTAGKGKGRTYPIRAKRKPFLVFQLGYMPKTAPGGDYYDGPGVATGEWRKMKEVRHPGITPRNFEKRIATKRKGWFNRTMKNAWRRVIRRVTD